MYCVNVYAVQGYSFPRVSIPVSVAFYTAWAMELFHASTMRLFGVGLQPLLLRSEVYKTSVTHYFKPDKAKRELGYTPLVDRHTAMRELVEYQIKQGIYTRKKSSGVPSFAFGALYLVLSLCLLYALVLAWR